jgi:subtilisin family serine protease
MPEMRFGGKQGRTLRLQVSAGMVAVRTASRGRLDADLLSAGARAALREMRSVVRMPAAGVEILEVVRGGERTAMRDRARAALSPEREIEFAGRVLCHPVSRVPALYTENLFVRFAPGRAPAACRRTLERHGVLVKREIPYLTNAWFAMVPEGTGMTVFDTATALLAEPDVERCHPEVVWKGSRRTASELEWHLGLRTLAGREIDAHSAVEAAWETTRGEGATIAVIDDGFDLDHEELASPGKVVSPRDATEDSDDPSPGPEDDHGTPCAGIACADGMVGASGVAPAARLLPVRLVSGLGAQQEADAIQWAAGHGADVIACSWGPEDGDWRDPNDPRHLARHPLPDSTREAIDWAVDNGRGGKGCVVCWAAGNGNESVDLDGYASYPRVMAVAASNDRGRRSPYSDIGDAVWCCFPSNDFDSDLTTGIWTIDRTGRAGFNPGRTKLGDRAGRYTNRFQGTSAACPGAAGVAALVLSAAPGLGWEELRDLLRRTAERIDPEGGGYDEDGHSPLYGYGRLHAERAVAGAVAAAGAREAAAAPAAPPPRQAIEIRVETAAPEVRVFLDGRALRQADGAFRAAVDSGETYLLSWWIGGEPGTPYRIAVSGAGGRFPVERTIPRRSAKAGGVRRLRIPAPRTV